MPGLRGRVLVLGPLPPPVHGAAVVTKGMLDWLRENGGSVSVVDASVSSHGIGSIASRFRVATYLLARLWFHLVCCVRLVPPARGALHRRCGRFRVCTFS
ncbi:MAG: hypothetical protein WKF47_05550 [Geodermatophilaceae bacterium]